MHAEAKAQRLPVTRNQQQRMDKASIRRQPKPVKRPLTRRVLLWLLPSLVDC